MARKRTGVKLLMAKSYCVFNIEQCDNLVLKGTPAPVQTEGELQEAFTAAVARTGATIHTGGTSAHYAPSTDHIQMPPLESFYSTAGYQATLAHELVHWSGAKSRLDRVQVGDRKSASYAFEELIAELGAAFTCSEHGITGELRHASYIESWISLLKDDPKALMRAASRASKAVAFLYPEAAAEEADAAEAEAEPTKIAA